MDEPGHKKLGRTDVLILAAAWVIATFVNLTKPFHIDDTAGLLIAKAIEAAPLHPMGQTLNWLDTAEPIFVTNQPHLFFYLMAGVGKLFGYSEFAMHLLLSVFSLIAVFAMFHLMRRVTQEHALWATVATVLGPGFLINQNVMTDVPLLALLCVSVLMITSPGQFGAIWGFLSFSSALLTKYTALFLVPAMLWAAYQRPRGLYWALMPLVGLSGWSLLNYFDVGSIHILNRPANSGGLIPSPKLAFALLCNLGVFSVPVAVFLMARRLAWVGAWVIGYAIFFAAQIFGFSHGFEAMMLPNAGLFASAWIALIAGGFRILSVTQLVISGPASGNSTRVNFELVLALWLIGGIVFLATFPPFMASRHALLLVPPLFALSLAGQNPVRPVLSFHMGALVVWAMLGLFVVANDVSFARFYRNTAPKAAAVAAELATPGAVVFTRGHWGWQWYAGQTEMVEYDSLKSVLAPGDILVDPVGISAQSVKDISDFETIGSISQAGSIFTLLDTHRFYASGTMTTPVFKAGPVREIRILRKRP